jgi:hypothetical protein
MIKKGQKNIYQFFEIDELNIMQTVNEEKVALGIECDGSYLKL